MTLGKIVCISVIFKVLESSQFAQMDELDDSTLSLCHQDLDINHGSMLCIHKYMLLLIDIRILPEWTNISDRVDQLPFPRDPISSPKLRMASWNLNEPTRFGGDCTPQSSSENMTGFVGDYFHIIGDKLINPIP